MTWRQILTLWLHAAMWTATLLFFGLAVTGCFGGFNAHRAADAVNIGTPPVGGDPRVFLGWWGNACFALSGIALVAGFTPLGKAIPRGAAFGGFALAVLSWTLQRWFNQTLWAVAVMCAVSAIVALWPYIAAARTWIKHRRTGRSLAAARVRIPPSVPGGS